ncbi:MAG: 2-amino-4-hydroxy-6-hydroxymethyldihydropteridine diphosphokinase [Phycisphaerales bacterium]|jgi:2-amino-4-hydroxy-6-hydroxymethyldihydropteridine diphosphokinase|nr:2-amino-4-hydroxy-6-hydroxymethyldihydropteridine diphosphokinase [Phycisphaerales bacterium]
MTVDVHIGLGSNLGDRVGAIFESLERLDRHPDVDVIRVSTLLESEPVDVLAQPAFVNAAAAVRTSCEPSEFLAILLGIELQMGRIRDGAIPRGPRPIDLDVLLWADKLIDQPGLTVPHPRMHVRTFVLLPLIEIAPTAVHPVLQQSITELLAHDVKQNGPAQERCQLLMRSTLESDSTLQGPGMEEV